MIEAPLDLESALDSYREMLRIRSVETRLASLYAQQRLPGFVHLSSGQESVPVAVSHHLGRADTVAMSHRCHGQALAKGMDATGLFAELLGKASGVCKGHGGSMHLADLGSGCLGANGIVGGGFGIANGSALAHKLDGLGHIAVVYFGDSAIAEGSFHESLNLAALWSLPCLFVCENNGWGEYSPTQTQFHGQLAKLAEAFDVEYALVDGIDVLEVSALAGRLINAMRHVAQPAVLECKVERLGGHHAGDAQHYRDVENIKVAQARDPIRHLRARLELAASSGAALDKLEMSVDAEIDTALEHAMATPVAVSIGPVFAP